MRNLTRVSGRDGDVEDYVRRSGGAHPTVTPSCYTMNNELRLICNSSLITRHGRKRLYNDRVGPRALDAVHRRKQANNPNSNREMPDVPTRQLGSREIEPASRFRHSVKVER
jgi:hypothetical protein